MIKLEHMRQFISVSQHSSLVDAAKALHRSPSAVSMTLKLIEEDLGQRLFEGERKNVLTPVGEHLYHHAIRLIEDYDSVIDEIRWFSKAQTGSVKIAAVPSVASQLLPEVITSLYIKHPDIQIDLRDIDSASVARAVTEKTSDFGIASLSAYSTDLYTELLTEEPFLCIVPHAHPLALAKTAIEWSDLSQYPFIANPLIDQIEHQALQDLTHQASLRIRNIASLTAFIRQGFGVTLLPQMAASLLPDLAALPIAEDGIKRSLYLMQAPDRSLSPTAELFKQAVCSSIKAQS